MHAAALSAWEPTSNYCVGVISDTHGKLNTRAYEALQGADLIVHAGDIGSEDILIELETIAPVIAVLGNNDWSSEYVRHIPEIERFERCGLSLKVGHIPAHARPYDADIVIVGHTHVPAREQFGMAQLINPGSASRSRSSHGRTVCRLELKENYLFSAVFIDVSG